MISIPLVAVVSAALQRQSSQVRSLSVARSLNLNEYAGCLFTFPSTMYKIKTTLGENATFMEFKVLEKLPIG
jgi:hypothetical protein